VTKTPESSKCFTAGPAVIKPAEIKTFQRQTQNIPPALVELRAADRPGGGKADRSGGSGGKADRSGGGISKAAERGIRPGGHLHPPSRLLGSQSGMLTGGGGD
jgi:hypothetical protein